MSYDGLFSSSWNSIYTVTEEKSHHKCPCCGKRFATVSDAQWVYKHKGLLLCSWSCLQKFRKGDKDHRYRADIETMHKREMDVIRWITSGIPIRRYMELKGIPEAGFYTAARRLRAAGYIDYEKGHLCDAIILPKYYDEFGGGDG